MGAEILQFPQKEPEKLHTIDEKYLDAGIVGSMASTAVASIVTFLQFGQDNETAYAVGAVAVVSVFATGVLALEKYNRIYERNRFSISRKITPLGEENISNITAERKFRSPNG